MRASCQRRSPLWTRCAIGLAAAALLLLASPGAARANDVVLFAEAVALLRQAEAAALPERGALLAQARDRLQRIVAEFPGSPLARQLQDTGVPVMGGAPVSLSRVRAEVEDLACLATPTRDCLLSMAAGIAAQSDPPRRARLFILIAEAESRAGLARDAAQTLQVARTAAAEIPRPAAGQQSQDRDNAFAAITEAEARAGMIDAALASFREISNSGPRFQPHLAIVEAQARAGQIDAAIASTRNFAEGSARAHALVAVAGAQARAMRMPEAHATAASARADPVAHVMALALVAEGERRTGLEARTAFAAAITAADGITAPPARMRALVAIASSQARTGDRGEAAAVFAQARALAEAFDEPPPPPANTIFYSQVGSRGEALGRIATAQAEAGLASLAEETAAAIAALNFARLDAVRAILRMHVAAGRIDAAAAAFERFDASFRWGAAPVLVGGLTQAGRLDDAAALLRRIPIQNVDARVGAMTEAAFGLDRARRLAEAGTLRPTVQALPPSTTPPAQPRQLRGAAEVLTTANLIVGNRAVRIAHIEGRGEAHARGIAAFIASRGGSVSCEPVPAATAMRCTTTDGIDLAEAALFNGGARATADAPQNYRTVEAAAREARRGIWAPAAQ